MYRTYKLKGDEKYFISFWDGDCTIYTVFETEEEMKKEKQRLQKIDTEYEETLKLMINESRGK